MNRKDSVILSRIRIGHTHYTHGYLMDRSLKPICDLCLTEITIKHIFEDCPFYVNERIQNRITSLQMSSGDDSNGNIHIIQFLKDCNLYKLIWLNTLHIKKKKTHNTYSSHSTIVTNSYIYTLWHRTHEHNNWNDTKWS